MPPLESIRERQPVELTTEQLEYEALVDSQIAENKTAMRGISLNCDITLDGSMRYTPSKSEVAAYPLPNEPNNIQMLTWVEFNHEGTRILKTQKVSSFAVRNSPIEDPQDRASVRDDIFEFNPSDLDPIEDNRLELAKSIGENLDLIIEAENTKNNYELRSSRVRLGRYVARGPLKTHVRR